MKKYLNKMKKKIKDMLFEEFGVVIGRDTPINKPIKIIKLKNKYDKRKRREHKYKLKEIIKGRNYNEIEFE